MVFHKIARFVKNISYTLLTAQSNFLQKRLIRKLGYDPKKNLNGCTVDISQELKDKKEKIISDVRAILKKANNNPESIIEYFETNNVPVYRIKKAEKTLKRINEKQGFITERHGIKAISINWIVKRKLKRYSEDMIIIDKEPDIYILINALHKWYSKKEGMDGFDEQSQRLLRKFNEKNEDKLIKRLSIPEIAGLRTAIARDVEAIDFVTEYSKEYAGSKKALEKLQTDDGANI
jgi:hypothetical protein